ncbi:MarR family transcriptional regulator, partial [mine drainage metagenome]
MIPEPHAPPGWRLRCVSWSVNSADRLREQAHPGDVTWSQMSVLGRLERDGPATVTRLARAEGVRPQSMGATVSVLLGAGLLRGAA